MSRTIVGFTAFTVVALLSTMAGAADYKATPRTRPAVVTEKKSPYCGCQCGCPIVTLVRHRQLVMAYPASFDPRTRDEPHYYYGGTRTYARFENNVVKRNWW